MSKLHPSYAALLAALLPVVLAGQAKKVEAPTGVVTGQVSCSDTNAPARFAVVTLERVPEEKESTAAKAKPNWQDGEVSMNATATTDLEGRFVIDKVPVGRYFVVAILSGYMGPLARFDHDDLKKVSAETRKEMLRLVPTVNVEAGQAAQVAIRLDHASELGGTVLYDDGSPAIHLKVNLLRKTRTGEIVSMDGMMIPGFGSQVDTDDRGRYRIIGVPPGEYSLSASIHLERVAFAGLIGNEGISINSSSDGGGEVSVYSGNKFRRKEAKVTKVGEGEQLGGLDITIPLAGLHRVQGTVTAKRDGHPLNRARVALLYENDGIEAQFADIDGEGNFALPHVPEDRYLLRVTGAQDVEMVWQSPGTWEEEKTLKKYGQVEMPLLVQADMTSLELAVPELTAAKAPAP